MTDAVLSVERLSARLRGRDLLRDVSLRVAEGEVHGLVGMSGAGKSMIGRAILGMLPAGVRITGGSIRLAGLELTGLGERAHRSALRGLALIPQDPLSALNPSRRIGGQVTDVMRLRLEVSAAEAERRALRLLSEVHIREPGRVMQLYPHELSGGMRQRVLIAAAFAAEPRLIIADEPTTALDVTVQKQILRLLRDLQRRRGTAILFVTHDLGVVAKICNRVSVLREGAVVEQAPIAEIMAAPRHPYTRALFAATPRYDRPEGAAALPPELAAS